MARIIECVPNCSEGKNKEIIEYIADAVRSVPGVALMDYSSDENHNRSVFTIVGDPDQMGEAAFRFAKACVEKIDMTKHHGEHPRMGAVDVIPFTPVKDVSMEECVELSKKVGQRIWEELKMPVTLYEESATAPHRRNLAAIRKGQFEGMPEKLQDPKWYPDYGNHEIHPTAGIVAVGHRVVQGGRYFDGPALITDEVRNLIEELCPLAPLHNPAHLKGIDVARELMPDVPHVAVFDTAFHATMPPKAYMYPLPARYYDDYRIRRYGAHGTSHRYAAQQAANPTPVMQAHISWWAMNCWI